MRIFIAGDFYCKNPDKKYLSEGIREELSSCDVRILNFEAPIDGPHKTLAPKSGPRMKQPEGTSDWLKENGFNMIATANNHVFDYGMDGFNKTRELLSQFELIGSGSWSEAYQIHVRQKDGLKVGFINLCELQFGVLHDRWSEKCPSVGCAWINHPCVDKLIIEERSKVDYLIAITHAGLENTPIPLPEWRERYRQLIELGCDAVVGGHPHAVQGYEVYQGKPIFYSLGNFCFPSKKRDPSSEWFTGAYVTLDLQPGHMDFKFTGVHNEIERITLIDDVVWKEKVQSLNQALGEQYMDSIDKICKDKLSMYWQLFGMGGLIHPDKKMFRTLGKLLLGRRDTAHLLNNLQCETHRWCVSRALRNELS